MIGCTIYRILANSSKWVLTLALTEHQDFITEDFNSINDCKFDNAYEV